MTLSFYSAGLAANRRRNPSANAEEREVTIMFCNKCGAQLPDGSTFCGNCGAPQTVSQPVNPQPAGQNPAAGTPKKKKKGGCCLWVLIAIVAVILMIAVVSCDDSGSGSSGSSGGSGYSGGNTSLGGGSNSGNSNSGNSNTGNNNSGSSNTGNNNSGSSTAEGNMTLMVYMVGSDLESKYGCATNDIVEMIDSKVDTSEHNILIYTGGARVWNNDVIPSDKNCIYRLEDDGILLEKELSRKNMADDATLAEFLSYGLSNYPADNYGLILWNHGAGPWDGYGYDENAQAMMSVPDLAVALGAGGFGAGQKLEFLGFDACLMGTAEVAHMVQPFANYLIASQETEPGFGWNYAFLDEMNSTVDGARLGSEIVDSYFTAYNAYVAQDPTYSDDLTLSCLDLSRLDGLETSLNDLFGRIETDILAGQFSKISRARRETKAFGKRASSREYDLVDIAHLANLLQADYPTEATAVKAALGQLVTYNRANVNNAGGLSIYHPYDNRAEMDYWVNLFSGLGFAREYASYINNFRDLYNKPGSKAWATLNKSVATAEKKGENNELRIQLTAEQAANYASSAYYILKKDSTGAYKFIFGGFDTTLDSNGVLSASYDNKAVYAVDEKTGRASDDPVTMYQVRDGLNDENRYMVSAMFWFFGEDITQWKTDPVEWQIKIEDGKVTPMGAYLIGDETGVPQKQLLNYKDYSNIEFSFSTRTPKTDANGNVLPYFQWDSTGIFYGNEFDPANGIRFECRKVENNQDFYVMFVVNDVQGNSYASELFTLPG